MVVNYTSSSVIYDRSNVYSSGYCWVKFLIRVRAEKRIKDEGRKPRPGHPSGRWHRHLYSCSPKKPSQERRRAAGARGSEVGSEVVSFIRRVVSWLELRAPHSAGSSQVTRPTPFHLLPYSLPQVRQKKVCFVKETLKYWTKIEFTYMWMYDLHVTYVLNVVCVLYVGICLFMGICRTRRYMTYIWIYVTYVSICPVYVLYVDICP